MSTVEQDFNSNIPCSVVKVGSNSRKCSCPKAMFFKSHRCKHCRCRCHKKSACGKHTAQRPLYPGDDHWTKVLQANEHGDNPCYKCHHCRKRRHSCSKHVAATGSSCSTASSPDEKKNNVLSNLYSRFCQWVATAKTNAAASSRKSETSYACHHRHCHHQRHSGQQNNPGSQTLTAGGDQHLSGTDVNGLTRLSLPVYDHEFLHPCFNASSMSLGENEGGLQCKSRCSTCSSLNSIAVYSTSSGVSDCYFSLSSPASTVTTPTSDVDIPGFPSSPDDVVNHYSPRAFDFLDASPKRMSRKERLSLSHSVGRTLGIVKQTSFPEKDESPLWATWPQTGRKLFENVGDEDDVSVTGSVYGDYDSDDEHRHENTGERDISSVLRDTLGECSIVYDNLEFAECIHRGRKCNIYRGKCYGEVVIHEYQRNNEQGLAEFWEEVAQLRMIRHENIALFMGACIEPPHLAVVTCLGKVSSLFEQIHVKQAKIGMHTRLHIARQVAQGLGYLHARGVVMRFLNSRNIFLESKVKLSLLDDGAPDIKDERAGYGCIKRGSLTYLAPECLQTLRVVPPGLVCEQPYSVQTDVFAFGTILFELVSNQFPFYGTSCESIIWQVSHGKRQSLQHIKGSSTFKVLIEECWSQSAEDRPECSHISMELQRNTAINKKHSCSEPETLNRSGVGISGNMSLYR